MADPNIIVTKTLTQKIRKGFLDIPYFVHEFIEEDTHAEQDQCLRGMRLRPVTTISSGNRWGKGDLIDFYMTWLAVYKPFAEQFKKKEVSILNTSISQDQANIVLDKFKSKILQKPKMQAFVSDVKQSPFPNIIFNSGVTWWFRNASQGGKYLEGRAYAHINFDEADLQDNYAQFIEDIIMPRTWDYAGSISHTTTPRKGKTNAYKIWLAAENAMKSGSADCFSFYGDSRANKFLPQQTIDKFNKLPARLFNKNVLGRFEDSQGSISSQAVDFAATISCNLQQDPEPGHSTSTGGILPDTQHGASE